MEKKKFYITTPIYYVNASPHVGHAYTQVAVDALARYHKMLGKDVFFLTGTDEHGEKIEEASEKAGFGKGEEKKFVDGIVPNFKKVWEILEIEYDYFVRTTDVSHSEEVGRVLNEMKRAGDIYQGEYDGWFCTPCETFWTQAQATEGVCPECGRPLKHIKEKNYFFRMSKYQSWLVDYIKRNPNFIMPKYRRNEVLGFLKEELTDLCISRPKERMSWGVELPFDTDYVVYVWFDALINYISALSAHGKFDEFWPADFHVIAKDILRHHAVYWPIMLRSLGMKLPKCIFAHGWWKMGKDKMSKSIGNVADPVQLSQKYGPDALRYFLLRTISFGLDGNFSEEALRLTYNNDLANDLGNLLNRTLTMVEKYFGGFAPEAPVEGDLVSEQLARSGKIMKNVSMLFPKVNEFMQSPELLLRESLEQIMFAVDAANKYIEVSAPWKYAKEDNTEAIKLIMADLLEVLRSVAIALFPFMPQTSEKIWRQLGLKGEVATKEILEIKSKETSRSFPIETKVAKGKPLFPRMNG